jgi:hypothetical protein
MASFISLLSKPVFITLFLIHNMRMSKISISLLFLFLFVFSYNGRCQSVKPKIEVDTAAENYDRLLTKLEQQAIEKNTDSLGILIDTVRFIVKTDDTADFNSGFIPWIDIAKPEKDVPQLMDKDIVAIKENKVTIIIDYPLTVAYRFTLKAGSGFTRERLINEISRTYHKLYKAEEASATVKTTPADQRTTVYNRNQTDGKYGIWGHDITDLSLSYILVYRAANGEIILSLNIES